MRLAAKARVNGIAQHVAKEVVQIELVGHDPRSESALKDVAAEAVFAIERLCPSEIQAVHAGGQIFRRSFDYEVVVIRDQRICEAAPFASNDLVAR